LSIVRTADASTGVNNRASEREVYFNRSVDTRVECQWNNKINKLQISKFG